MRNETTFAIPDPVHEANQRFLQRRLDLADDLRRQRDGLLIAGLLEEITDQWLLRLWELAIPEPLREVLSLHAIGGYGRSQLALHSDLDVLIAVHVDDLDTLDGLEESIERLMMWARQTRHRLSHVVRTPAQALENRQDFPSAVALLDRRPLAESASELPPAFQRDDLLHFLRGKDQGRSFVSRLLDGHRRRGVRQGETVFLLEPDIKHGEGGLRDLNDLAWAAQVRWDLDVLHPDPDLRDRARWKATLATTYRQALGEILAMRNLLHLFRGRKHDRLTFREQRQFAAHSLGIDPDEPPDDPDAFQAEIESQMAAYYQRARSVDVLCERSLRRWAAPDEPPRRLTGPFQARGERLAIDLVIDDQPDGALDPFEALRLADEHDLLLDPALEALMEEEVRRWPAGDDSDPEHAAALRELLVDPTSSWRTSRRLLELGILPRIVPEFAPLLCHVQHDLYHVYTTDIHSLKCLEAGRSLLADDPDSFRWPFFAHAARAIEDTEVFLLSCLVHDIGKNRGGNHSERGADLVAHFGPRLGLTEPQVSRLRFLVLHHLDLSLTSRRRDISDPRVLEELATRIGTLECLHQLTALTYCDMSTVGPDVMNDWNASLLIELTTQISRRLQEGPLGADDEDERRREATVQELARHRPDLDTPALQRFLDELPSDHFLSYDEPTAAAADLIRQFETFHAALSADDRVAVSHEILADRGVTEIVVCAPDRPGTLARIAGAIASTGLNIMAADILTTASGQTLDRFRVAHYNPRAVPPVGHQPVTDSRRIDRLKTRVADVLTDRVDLDQLLSQRRGEQRLSPRAIPSVSTEVRVIDSPPGDDSTILEIRAPDRLGLLYTIADALLRAGVTTRVSRVDSLGAQAIDTFYVAEVDGSPLSPIRVDEIIDRLFTVLSEDDDFR